MLQKIPVFLLTVLLLSCKKDPSTSPSPTNSQTVVWQLPAETTSGKGTFGCLINGQLWLPSSAISPPLTFSRSHSRLTIHANDDSEYAFVFVCPPIKKDTTFTVSDNTIHNLNQSFSCYFMYGSVKVQGLPVHGYQGTFTFTRYDTVNSIYSGTFSLNAIDTVSGQTIQLTQGRFDL
ncbi:MAG TPA: hypothetical protein VNZ86_18740 [Bacteroidia bacterium]|nr:hypothetical protein [Bacteroidia bacterium]